MEQNNELHLHEVTFLHKFTESESQEALLIRSYFTSN